MNGETHDVTLNPEPGILIQSLRDIGYSFNSALADIIDNSISAYATHISVMAIPTDDFRIAIIDDGEGLSEDDLKQAMRLGSSDPREERALNDLGRFGLGLKTASFSQCRRLTVASRRDGETHAFTWDLDLVVEKNEWTIIEYDNTDEIPYVNELGLNGTLVLWEKLDRLTGNKGLGSIDHSRVISEAQDYLALVFHRYLAGEHGLQRISIQVNYRELDPIDPFNMKNKATQAGPLETVCPGVTLQSFTLPHKANYDSQQEYEKYGLRGGYLRNQGIYLYRAKRLILSGTWFGIAKKTPLTQLNRVRIDIDINQDEAWKIDVKKVSAQMPEVVRERVKNLIATMGAPSKKVYRRRGQRLTRAEVYPAWSIEKTGDKTIYKINRENPIIHNLIESLDEDEAKSLNTAFSLIESTFPTESLFYEFSNNEDGVVMEPISDEAFVDSCKTFFAQLKQNGMDEESILSVMRSAELFGSRWQETLNVLGIEEQ